jgi:protein ImuA
MPTDERHHVLAALRETIQRIERRPARRAGYLASGLPELDAALPGGGFPRGALSELCGGQASGKTVAALAVLAALPAGELCAWIDARGELYPPGVAARGVDLSRLLIVRPPGGRPSDMLWAAEAVLGSGAFAAVVVDVPLGTALRGWDAAARRLQAAAEKGGAVGLWLGEPGAAVRVPAAVRLALAMEHGELTARCAAGPLPERPRAGHAA